MLGGVATNIDSHAPRTAIRDWIELSPSRSGGTLQTSVRHRNPPWACQPSLSKNLHHCIVLKKSFLNIGILSRAQNRTLPTGVDCFYEVLHCGYAADRWSRSSRLCPAWRSSRRRFLGPRLLGVSQWIHQSRSVSLLQSWLHCSSALYRQSVLPNDAVIPESWLRRC